MLETKADISSKMNLQRFWPLDFRFVSFKPFYLNIYLSEAFGGARIGKFATLNQQMAPQFYHISGQESGIY
jgi:hypothetical protein